MILVVSFSNWVSKISFYLIVHYASFFSGFSIGACVNVYAIFSAFLCLGLSKVILLRSNDIGSGRG